MAEARVEPGSTGPREAALLTALAAGDPAAFDAVYSRYRAPLHGFLLRMTRRRDLAEDLLQETWLRLARSAPRLAPDTALRPWLFTVARNLFVSYRRWALLDVERLRELGLWPRGDAAATPFDSATASETERRLERALAALAPPYREAILLVAVEQLEPAEAARVVSLKPDAFRQRLSRARGMLEVELARTERRSR